MRMFHFCLPGGQSLVCFLAILTGAAKVSAQPGGSPIIPIVTVQATQPVATSNKPGVFTMFRSGNTNAAVNVWYELGGSASNGADYAPVPPHLMTIAAGATSNTIVITPLTGPPPASVAKTVVLTLTNSPLLTPINYQIGSPSSALVYVKANGATNLPPAVRLIAPPNGSVYDPPANVQMIAKVSDTDGFITGVEFFAGTIDLGPGALVVLDPPGVIGVTGPVWIFNWLNAPSGDYPLTAVAADNGGASTTSDAVNITVLPGSPTNLPPVAQITSPTNGQTFFPDWHCPPCATNVPPCEAPCYLAQPDIMICADARDADGYVNTVEFFAGTNSLGIRTNCLACASPQNPFCLTWGNVPAGEYVLSAKATDNDGASTISGPVKIAVLSSPPPPTNLPPVVRIVSPPNGAAFWAPVNIPMYAYASDPDSPVASVEFFAGANSLGFGRPVPVAVPPGGSGFLLGGPLPPVYPTNIYFLVWSNAVSGVHVLTAKATDNAGDSSDSNPIKITVLPSPPPPTNRPPVVDIVATDPVAIEGTNCWVWPGETNATPTWAAWPAAACRYFTNCGPKTATFTVRRFGDTNGDLTVAYAVGGSASNGVDYVALPGSVTVPAGERHAWIMIVPVDDGPSGVNKTVVLVLTPSTNTPPDYVIGYPPRAAAIIIDSNGPRPATAVLADKCFHLAVAGPDAAWFSIQCSTDLVHWTSVCTNQVVHGSIDFIDPDAAGNPGRFYRVVPLNGVPAG